VTLVAEAGTQGPFGGKDLDLERTLALRLAERVISHFGLPGGEPSFLLLSEQGWSEEIIVRRFSTLSECFVAQ
jgi:hypothetical protein